MPDDPFGGAAQKIPIEARAASGSHRNQENIVFVSVVKETARRGSLTSLSNRVNSLCSSLCSDTIRRRFALRVEVPYYFCRRSIFWTGGNVAHVNYLQRECERPSSVRSRVHDR
jgi:hypothetical protein